MKLRYSQDEIQYVSVQLYYTKSGEIQIEAIEWSDGRTFRVEDRRDPIKTGDHSIPEIYPVKIRGARKDIYYQDPQFFVLKKGR